MHDLAKNVLRLEGGFNARDLGGILAANGRRVRHGLVFRSASLSELTEADQAELAARNVRFVIDFRSTPERVKRPSRLSLATWTRDYDASSGDLTKVLTDPSATASHSTAAMMRIYETLHVEQGDAIAVLFRHIIRGNLPVLFHCAAGKDRTGVAAALLLNALGVDQSDIEADYLFTRKTKLRNLADIRAGILSFCDGVSDEVLLPIADVDVRYLNAMVEALARRFGSVEGYLATRGITQEDILAVQAVMLEEQPR